MEVKAGSPLHSRRTFYQVFCHLVNKSNFLKYPCALEFSNCDQAPFLGSYEAYERETLVRDPKSIWYIENEWSPDLKSLAEQAVLQKLSLKDIEQIFETLILRGKNITEVDRSVLKLKRLRCLILSVNNITEVFGSHLPKCLEILELYGNQIEDISKLCQNSPPGLLYVGLGQNRLHTLPSTNFPVLCTLDLTDNFLSNLTEVVAQLKSLGSLRSLALFGNPMTLAWGYRGYVITQLTQLWYLDDTLVTTAEKWVALEKIGSVSLSEVTKGWVTLEIHRVLGIPKVSPKNDEKISTSYYIQYFPGLSQVETERSSVMYRTHLLPWDNEIIFSHVDTLMTQNLTELHALIRKGLLMEIKELQVLAHWQGNAPSAKSSSLKQSKKDSKPKKEDGCWIEDSSVTSVLATFLVPLSTLSKTCDVSPVVHVIWEENLKQQQARIVREDLRSYSSVKTTKKGKQESVKLSKKKAPGGAEDQNITCHLTVTRHVI